MKTLGQYNTEQAEYYKQKNAMRFNTNVVCDTCGTELLYKKPGVLLMSCPPQSEVVCPKCKKSFYMTR